MELSYYHYQSDSDQIYYEKLFSIIDKLHSICNEAKTLPNSEQFILGVEASIKVLHSAISGNLHKNTSSIYNPDQIPLI